MLLEWLLGGRFIVVLTYGAFSNHFIYIRIGPIKQCPGSLSIWCFSNIVFRRACDISILSPLNMIPSMIHNSSLTDQYSRVSAGQLVL